MSLSLSIYIYIYISGCCLTNICLCVLVFNMFFTYVPTNLHTRVRPAAR